MTYVRRLRAVGAALALMAVITTSHVWGDPAKPSAKRLASAATPDPVEEDVSYDLANTKFAAGGVLTYRTTGGELLFSLQLKAKLEAGKERPRDYLVMVDTSAS